MKKVFKKCFCLVLGLILTFSCVACSKEEGGNSSDKVETTKTDSFVPTEPIDIERAEYLSTVTYRNFELTGKNEPYFVGRWFDKEIDNENHKVTVTAGSSIYFLVENSASFDLNFTVITTGNEPYFAYSIDGSEPVRQHITNPTVTLPDTNRHTVRIIADGLDEYEGKWIEEKGFALKSITANGGNIVGIKPTEPVIFFYGDSITEGVRALSMELSSEGNSATNAYPWYCSEALGAVPYMVGYGASGITKTGSFHNFRMAIEYLSKDRKVDTKSITPDIVVINHGTNDGGAKSDKFKQRLTSALTLLRETYPDVPIVYMLPLNQSHANNIVQVVTEFKNTHIVQTSGWEITFTDSLHPDAAGAKVAGENLAKEIIKIFGEDFFEAK